MKRKFFDKLVIQKYGTIVSWISVIVSLIAIIVPFPEEWSRTTAIAILLLIFAAIYVFVWIWANKLRKVTLKVRNTKIVIKEGDIFEESCKKIIPFNEYFDTQIGDGIVDADSLHGIYLRDKANRSPDELYDYIITQLTKRREKPSVIDEYRNSGRQIKFDLGTICDDGNDFLLLAYSRFDSENRACMTQNDLMKCYMNMWNEIDILRGNNSISMPLLGGSGLVRFSKDYSSQQLVELLLWSFRVSGINLSRNSTLNIVIYGEMADEIDFLKLGIFSD